MRRPVPRHSRRRLVRGSLALAGLGLLSGCGMGTPWAPRPVKVARLGILDVGPRGPDIEEFLQALGDLGYIDGRDIAVDYRGADSEDRLPDIAVDLVRSQPDVIMTGGGGPAALAAKRATEAIPIVAVAVGDPVGMGLVASLARPGGNVTGLTSLSPELAGKRLDLLKEAFPGISRVAVLWNPALPDKQHQFRQSQAAARLLGLQVQSLEVLAVRDFDSAFAAATDARADALLTLGDPLTSSQLRRIVDFAAQGRLPAMYELGELAVAGGLMAYGPKVSDFIRRAAAYVDKILKGAKPADLPVEQPTRFDFVINLKTARALGLTIPQSVLQQATEVIE